MKPELLLPVAFLSIAIWPNSVHFLVMYVTTAVAVFRGGGDDDEDDDDDDDDDVESVVFA